MANFTLTFATDNAAFDEGNLHVEIARILRDVADTADSGINLTGRIMIRDINGNRVGSFGVQED